MIRLSPAQRAHLVADIERRLGQCVPWSRKLRYQTELNIQASTYPITRLFPEVAPSDAPAGDLQKGEYIDSPGGRFRYVIRLHRRGRLMETWFNQLRGSVVFDDDVEIPVLYEKRADGQWGMYPWMSLTPAELLTLRPGTKLARGRTVIAGLGLAHQLIEVGKRQAVTEITVVERSSELCDLIMPRAMVLLAASGKPKVKVIVGDAFKILPTLEADVALVDVFPEYGNNHAATAQLARACKKIGKVWGWGGSDDDP